MDRCVISTFRGAFGSDLLRRPPLPDFRSRSAVYRRLPSSIVTSLGGNVYTWGWGGSHGTFSVDGHSSGGQLGQGNDVDYIMPTKINFPRHVKALQVSCGFNHTGAIFEYS
ncbi:hypothetical protein H5410_029311 [Solanum commersonii]|uniref:Uncharacterized protein n=1 Tax=Solanum commersonii TaxID=4109 RepID=A0A9J5Z4C4_SOLCO|nr:hypothetical protein H5410_029311 [Solanum commersonii]